MSESLFEASPYTSAGAEFDAERVYRYRLWREWDSDPQSSRILWLMLNPSSADEKKLDPTLRKVESISRRDGFGSFEVVNLFALRSPDPDVLLKSPFPVGEWNDNYISDAALRAQTIVCAWGSHKSIAWRVETVLARLRGFEERFRCLGRNADGQPKHPLFLPNITPLVQFEVRSC